MDAAEDGQTGAVAVKAIARLADAVHWVWRVAADVGSVAFEPDGFPVSACSLCVDGRYGYYRDYYSAKATGTGAGVMTTDYSAQHSSPAHGAQRRTPLAAAYPKPTGQSITTARTAYK